MTVNPSKPSQRGVYTSYHFEEPTQRAYEVTVHSAEIRALRDAITSGKYVVFVPYGQSVEAAHRAAQEGETGVVEPLPVDDTPEPIPAGDVPEGDALGYPPGEGPDAPAGDKPPRTRKGKA